MFKHEEPARLRGRAGVQQRERRRYQHPLCAHCLEEGVTTPTDEIDHVVPLALGGTDTDDNVQGLCTPHHLLKSAQEDASHGGAANHPDWLKPSAIPLVIVSGPPCAGKTTYIQQRAAPGDVVIDLDGIMRRINPAYQHWAASLNAELLNKAIRVRNAMLGSLARQTNGRAWFIVSAPSRAERDWWRAKLGGEVLLLHPGAEECKRRAIARGTPKAIDGVDKWEASSKAPWAPTKPAPRKQAIGTDGWPIESR